MNLLLINDQCWLVRGNIAWNVCTDSYFVSNPLSAITNFFFEGCSKAVN